MANNPDVEIVVVPPVVPVSEAPVSASQPNLREVQIKRLQRIQAQLLFWIAVFLVWATMPFVTFIGICTAPAVMNLLAGTLLVALCLRRIVLLNHRIRVLHSQRTV
jgi:hypothetical protein